VNCQETRALLPEYQEAALAEAKRREADAHLANCVSCKAALAEAKNLDRFLRGAVRVPERPLEDWTKQEGKILLAAAHSSNGSRPGSRRIPPYLWMVEIGLGIAAALLLAVGIYVLSSHPDSSAPPQTDVVHPSPATDPRAKPEAPSRPAKKFSFDRPERSVPPREPDPGTTPFPPSFARRPDPDSTPAPTETPTFTPQVTAVSSLLPGDPDHLDRLTEENIEVGLADSPSERVMGLIKAADSRLSELRAAVGAKKDSTAENIVASYTMICRQGIAAILADREESPQDIATARVVAKTYAGWNVDGLAKLETAAQGSLKSALHEALLATRELAGQ
jgi:putative zinc finger protein